MVFILILFLVVIHGCEIESQEKLPLQPPLTEVEGKVKSIQSPKTLQEEERGSIIRDKENNSYMTVTIGKQVWMAENLRTVTFGSWCPNEKEENCMRYGRHYCWYAAIEACPTGWRLPTDEDWKELELYLGMDSAEVEETGNRGTIEGGKLKSVTPDWDHPNEGATNESGFSALPAGPRYKLGMYGLLGHNATFWTSTETDSSHAYFRYVGHSHTRIGRIDNEKVEGHSVRCIKDL